MAAPIDIASSPIDLASYAGRWVALVYGQVAGVGLTPGEANQLAKGARPKEEPIVLFVSVDFRDGAAK
jgi:hypothetical protein